MLEYAVLNVLVLCLGILGVISGKSTTDFICGALICVLIFSFSYFRELGLADDQNYFLASHRIANGIFESPIKYGIGYKAYVQFIESIGFTSVQSLISGPTIFLMCIMIFSRSNFAAIAALFFFTFQIQIFIQNRQGLALVLILAGLLNNYRTGVKSSVFLFLAALVHVSVAPFVATFLLLKPTLKKFSLMSVILMTCTTSACLIFISLSLDKSSFYENMVSSFPTVKKFASLQALTEGHVGIGGVLWYTILTLACTYLTKKEDPSPENHSIVKLLYLGYLTFAIGMLFPLLQRLSLPFFLLGLLLIAQLSKEKTKVIMLCAVFLLSQSRYGKFVDWQFCDDCQNHGHNSLKMLLEGVQYAP